MDFVRASSNLIGGIRLDDIAREFGVTRGSIGQSRLARSNPQYRNPPAGWEAVVAKLARKRAAQLTKLADRLSKPSTRSKTGTRSVRKKTRGAASKRKTAKRAVRRSPAKRKATKRSKKR